MEGLRKTLDVVKELEKEMDMANFETTILQYTLHCRQLSTRYRKYSDDMAKGVYAALAGKLSPEITDPGDFHKAINQVMDIAMSRKYLPLTTILSHIYELPCSSYVHFDRSQLDIIVHIPLSKGEVKSEIWEHVPVPYINNTKHMTEVERREHDDSHNTAWAIKDTGSLVMFPNRGTFIASQLFRQIEIFSG